MITTLYNFARLLEDDEELKVYFTPSENPFEGRIEKGKVIIGNIIDGKFNGWEIEDFAEIRIPKYLYRKPPGANGTNAVPTLYVNLKELPKTSKKIIQSISNNNLTFITERDLEKAISEFEAFDLNKDYCYIVTFKIDGKYFGDYDEFISVFNDEAYKKYHQKNYGQTKKENILCAITGEINTIYGFVDTLGFTVDSDAFRRNGFDPNHAYTMFPVSEKVISILEGAKGILMNKVAAYFYGNLKYAIIPHFVFRPDLGISKYIARKFLEKAAFNADAKEDAGSAGFINDTECILNAIISNGELKRSDIFYTILFFEQQQAQFKIHLELNDVLPSRISEVLSAKKNAEQRYRVLTSYMTKEGNIKTQRITLFRLKEYFTTGDNIVQPAFYRLVNSIFTGQAYDDSKLLKLVLSTWRSFYKKHYHDHENTFNFLVKNSLGNLYFLYLIGIFKHSNIMSETQLNNEKLDAFSFIE